MASKFTFADAKKKIKDLELEVQMAKADIKKDVKKIGAGDVVIFLAGVVLGGLTVWIF